MDASVLIHLDRIDEVTLLRELVGPIHVTNEVAQEVMCGPEPIDLRSPKFRSWVTILPPTERVTRLGLGKGEGSVLLMARPGDRLVLDDAQARAVAEARGLEYVGLLGLLLAATSARTLSKHRALEVLDRLVATEFRLAPELYANARKAIEKAR